MSKETTTPSVTPSVAQKAKKPSDKTIEKAPAKEILAAELSANDTELFVAYKDNLVVLVKAEEAHDVNAKNMIDMFTALRETMVASGHPKATIPAQILKSLNILLDNDEELPASVLKRAKKELLTIVHYFQLSLDMRVREIKFTLFCKVVDHVIDENITKSAVSACLKKKDDAYVKALEALVVKAEYAKLVGSINMALIPADIAEMVNNTATPVLLELAKLIKSKTVKTA